MQIRRSRLDGVEEDYSVNVRKEDINVKLTQIHRISNSSSK